MKDTESQEARRLFEHHADLLRGERSCLAELLLSIADFEARALHRALGHATIFDYLHRGLRMSRGMAHYRMVASRLVRRFPEVEAPVRDGRLCLTTVVEVARVMTEENRAEVLPRFFELSREEARLLAVEIEPSAVVPRRTVVLAAVAALPIAAPPTASAPTASAPGSEPGQSSIVELDLGEVATTTTPLPRPVPTPSTTTPLNASESRLHITVSREFLFLLRKAKAGELHRSPRATDEEILKAALEALLEKQEKRRAGVPASVKRQVLKRDGGRCQWPLADGTICGSTMRLEIDHIQPRGRGGASTVENCRVLCKPHNLEAARQAYGDGWMEHFTKRRSRPEGPMAGEEVAG